MGITDCDSDSFCSDAIANAECIDGYCNCSTGYKTGTDNIVCDFNQVGDACDSDEDCSIGVENSECINGYCNCSAG